MALASLVYTLSNRILRNPVSALARSETRLNVAEQSGRRFPPHMDGGRVGFAIRHISNTRDEEAKYGRGLFDPGLGISNRH